MSAPLPGDGLRPIAPLCRCLPPGNLLKYAPMKERRGPISHREMQKYFAVLADGSSQQDAVRQANLLFSFAELKFRIARGGRCRPCHAHVRHVLPVEVQREDGSMKTFECLCTRCLVGEKASATRVTMRVGHAR